MSTSFTFDKGTLSYTVDGVKGEFPFQVPDPTEMLDDEEYGCCFLCSKYHTAESDYYKVNLNTNRKSVLGWVFPFNLLKEDMEFYSDFDDEYDALIQCMHVGIHKLTEYCVKNDLLKGVDNTIDDLDVSSDLILFIYRLNLCKEDSFQSLIPSLYDKGYHVIEDPKEIDLSRFPVNAYRKEKINEFRNDPDQKCINLRLISKVFSYNRYSRYLKTLFGETLVTQKDPFLRYFSLYQVVEILMEIAYSNNYFDYVEKYANDKRHNLMDKFGELSSEAKLIKKIYENKKKVQETKTKQEDFIDAAKELLIKMDIEPLKDNASFDDYMYKIRNLIVHDLQAISIYEQEMIHLSNIYESLIVDLMCNTYLKTVDHKLIFVIDKNQSDEVNLEALKNRIKSEGHNINWCIKSSESIH